MVTVVKKSMSGYIPHLFFRSSAYFSISSSRFLIICHFGLFYLLLSYLFKNRAMTNKICEDEEKLWRRAHKKALHEFHTGLASNRFKLCV